MMPMPMSAVWIIATSLAPAHGVWDQPIAVLIPACLQMGLDVHVDGSQLLHIGMGCRRRGISLRAGNAGSIQSAPSPMATILFSMRRLYRRAQRPMAPGRMLFLPCSAVFSS